MTSSPSVIVTHPTGNQNVRRLLSMLVREQMLLEFRTTVGFDENGGHSILQRVVGSSAKKRMYPMLEPGQLSIDPGRELVRNTLARSPVRALRNLAEGDRPFSVDWVADGLDARRAHSLEGASLFYGYSGFTHAHVEAANRLRLPALVEVQHAAWRATHAIVEEERERSPEWADTLPPSPSARKRDFEDRELESATSAVSPSRQVTDSLHAVFPHLRVVSAPYGCPAPVDDADVGIERGPRPRILFVGRIVALKGVADLLALVRAIGSRADITVIGPAPAVRSAAMDELLASVDYRGTMHRDDVLAQMSRHDLLVAPSLVEGRSLSILEAISRGTPIVVTPGTGVDDLALAGAGTVVPSADPARLIDVVDDLISDLPALRARREAVRDIARANGWDGFEQPILTEMRRLLHTR